MKKTIEFLRNGMIANEVIPPVPENKKTFSA